jgi:hypothetical protein
MKIIDKTIEAMNLDAGDGTSMANSAISIDFSDFKENTSYEICYSELSEHHQLSLMEFCEFLIRISSRVLHDELVEGFQINKEASLTSWSHFYTVDKFLDLIDRTINKNNFE